MTDDGTHIPDSPTTGGDPDEEDVRRTARNPQVAMDKYGNFTVVWESFRDNDAEADQAESYGIYYNRFSWTGFLTGPSVQQANLVITVPNEPDSERIESSAAFDMSQVNPSIAIDADGDFSIVWNGNGAEPDPLEPQNWQLLGDRDDSGVFMRSFHAASYLGGVDLNNDGVPEWALDLDGDGDFDFYAPGAISSPVGTQSRVNHTTAGVQEHATIAMEPDGDSIVVWSGTGVGDENGIFVRHYDEAADTAGPIVTELRTANGALIYDYDTLYGNDANNRSVYVVFSEDVRNDGGYNAVNNVNNWAVLDGNGEEIPGAIATNGVTFGYNSAWGKWVAKVTFATDTDVLPMDGEYTLVARTQIQDIAGNAMARTGFRPGGTGDVYGIDWKFLRKYYVQRWYDGGDPYTPVPSLSGGMGFTFRMSSGAATTPGDLVDSDERISSLPLHPITLAMATEDQDDDAATPDVEAYLLSMIGDHMDPAIARNDDGEYVAVWVRETLSDWTVLFESVGGEGGADAAGSGGALGWFAPIYQTDIVARRFDEYGRPLDTEFLVNSWISDSPFELYQTYFGQGQVEPDDNQLSPDVAIDNDGNFVVVWSGDGELLGDQTGIFGQKFDANGNKVGGNFRINKEWTERQSEPSIGMDPKTGNFVVSWTSRNLNVSGINSGDGSGDGVFHRRFDENCVAQDALDVLVNDTWTSGAQKSSDVAMDDQGRYIIVWQSDGQDGSQWGVYGQKYSWSDGGKNGGAFRVNAMTQAAQYEPQVTTFGRNGYVVAWTSFGQDGSDTGIYARSGLFTSTELFTEIRVNQTTERSQYSPHIDGNKAGTYVVSWTGYDMGGLESPDDLGVYARMLGTTPSNEFRLNAVQDGDQADAAVSIDAAGNVAAVWEGDNWFETNWVEPNWYNTGTWWFDPTWIEPEYNPDDQFGTQLPGPEDFMGIYTRVFGQSTAELTVQPEPRQTMAIAGTDGDDHLEFIGNGSGAGVVRVTTNGVSTDYPIPDGVTTIRFTGLGGNDRADITGTTDNEVFCLQPSTSGPSTYTGGPISVEIYETETINTVGGGGTDKAIIGDSTLSNDEIVAGPNSVKSGRRDGSGGTVYYLEASGIDSYQVNAASGGDTLALYDEAFDSGSFEFEPVLLYEHAHEGPFDVAVENGICTVSVNGSEYYTTEMKVRMDGNESSRDYSSLEGYAEISKQIKEGFHLGSGIDAESAVRVDDDDDGVSFAGLDLAEETATLDVSVNGTGQVSAWIDFDANGTFDADEKILDAVEVSEGDNSISFDWADVAGAKTVENAVARVVLTATDDSDVGEVEDYRGVRVGRTASGQIDTSIPGDLDGNGVVDSGDLNIIRAHWGETVTAGDLTMGDANGDAMVNSDDLNIIRANWGQSAPAAASQAPQTASMEAAPVESPVESPVIGPRTQAADALFDGLEVSAGSEATIAEMAWAYEVERLRAEQNDETKNVEEDSADRFFQMFGEE